MAYNKFTSKSGQNIKFDLRSNERWWADLILFIVIATVEVINVYLISEVKIRESEDRIDHWAVHQLRSV